MKAEQIIDEMQASLTKLRGHYRKKGTAGGYQCDIKTGKYDDELALGLLVIDLRKR